jgi:serine phosphatase RsbU (regulator of sigma subunit)
MAKKKAFDIWKEMKPQSLRRVGLAVFLMFGALGPISILMESALRVVTWQFIALQTIASGGIAASFILLGRKRWWVKIIMIILWISLFVFIRGGLSLVVDKEGVRSVLGPYDEKNLEEETKHPRILQPEELDTMYTQRALLGITAIVFLVYGYVSFVKVVRAEVRERSRLETEVKIAHDIQQSLIPCRTFENGWCKVAGMTSSAAEVGGDYFDIIPLSDNQLAIAIADVAGHGVGSGILSAMTKSALRLQLLNDASPAKVLQNLNQTIYQVSQRNMFVTFAYLLLDNTKHIARYATAGHPPMLLWRDSEANYTQLRTINPALGLQEIAKFEEVQIPFSSGDSFLLYTDGIVEAANPKGEEFGIARLQEQLSQHKVCTGNEFCSRIVDAVRTFTGSDVLRDDVSVVCVEL